MFSPTDSPDIAPLNKSGVLSSQYKMVTFEGHEIEGVPWITMSTGPEIEDDIDYSPTDFLRMMRVAGDALIASLHAAFGAGVRTDRLEEMAILFGECTAVADAIIDDVSASENRAA